MDQEKIGKFIFNKRRDRGLSQEQLAKMVPVSRQAVSSWELGKSLPDIGTLLKLSKIFDVSIDEILLGTDLLNDKVSS